MKALETGIFPASLKPTADFGPPFWRFGPAGHTLQGPQRPHPGPFERGASPAAVFLLPISWSRLSALIATFCPSPMGRAFRRRSFTGWCSAPPNPEPERFGRVWGGLILSSSPRIARGVGRRQSLQGIASHPAETPLGEHFGPVTAVELDGGRVPIEDRPFEATTTPFQGQ